MKLSVLGVNHRTAPVAVREQLAFDEKRLPEALHELRERHHFSEALILSTCNRVEIAVSADDTADSQASVESFLTRARSLDPALVRQHMFAIEGWDAVRHIFRVAASLDSMVVGEPQILGQLKAAYSVAKAHGALSGFLDTVLTRAFSVAKRVRSETEIGVSAVSVSYAAVELAREIFGSLTNRHVMLIGAGKMSELAARHLARSGAAQITVTNRTRQRAEQVAEMVGGRVIDYQQFRSAVAENDIVITSSGATGYVLTRDEMKRIIEARKNRPMFVIDIAVPRNVEPAVNDIDGVFVYDVDDLQQVVDRNLRSRLTEAEQADRIVGEEVRRLESWMRAREAAPLIVSLQEQLERLRLAEIERMRAKLGVLSPQQEEALEALTRGLMNKVAHGPIAELRRNSDSPQSEQFADAVRRIFRLDSK